MDLELRDVTVSDLSRLTPLVTPFLCDPLRLEALRAMWSEIVGLRCGIATIAADLGQEPSTIIHFCFGVFVSDQRVDEYHQCRRPLISRRLLAEWCAGERPFLHMDDIARANASLGLNLVMTHFGGRRSDPRSYIANYESSRRAIRGWNLRSFTAEMYSDPPHDNRAWGRSLGYRVLEYSADVLRAAGIPQDQAPFVWAANRRDAELNPGYATALLFTTFAAPRIAFTPLEQHLLTLALDDATDAVIARAAGFSKSAVKKHFRELYEKARAAGVFNGVVTAGEPAEATRGVELRRHLLTYLREHPEELRPYARSAARSVPHCNAKVTSRSVAVRP